MVDGRIEIGMELLVFLEVYSGTGIEPFRRMMIQV
jgi:hypothetical protein